MTEQLSVPGTEPRKKRRTILEQAVVGDLVIAFHTAPDDPKQVIVAVEQLDEERDGTMIRDRWIDQGVITDARIDVVVFECRPGGYYRKRKAGR